MLVDCAIQHDPQYFEGWAIHVPTRITQSDMLWPLKRVDFGGSSREGGNKGVHQGKQVWVWHLESNISGLYVEGMFEDHTNSTMVGMMAMWIDGQ